MHSPGMPEMLSPGAALVGAGLGKKVALVTDGRFSGASHGEKWSVYNVRCTALFSLFQTLKMRPCIQDTLLFALNQIFVPTVYSVSPILTMTTISSDSL